MSESVVWYESKYARAFVVAFCTGLVAAAIIFLGILDDEGLSTRQVVKIVGLAFFGPFATLIRFLPSFETLFGSQGAAVRAGNIENVTVVPREKGYEVGPNQEPLVSIYPSVTPAFRPPGE